MLCIPLTVSSTVCRAFANERASQLGTSLPELMRQTERLDEKASVEKASLEEQSPNFSAAAPPDADARRQWREERTATAAVEVEVCSGGQTLQTDLSAML